MGAAHLDVDERDILNRREALDEPLRPLHARPAGVRHVHELADARALRGEVEEVADVDWNGVLHRRERRARVQHVGAEVGELPRLVVREPFEADRLGHLAGVRGVHPVDVRPDCDDAGLGQGAHNRGGVVGAVAAEGRGDAFGGLGDEARRDDDARGGGGVRFIPGVEARVGGVVDDVDAAVGRIHHGHHLARVHELGVVPERLEHGGEEPRAPQLAVADHEVAEGAGRDAGCGWKGEGEIETGAISGCVAAARRTAAAAIACAGAARRDVSPRGRAAQSGPACLHSLPTHPVGGVEWDLLGCVRTDGDGCEERLQAGDVVVQPLEEVVEERAGEDLLRGVDMLLLKLVNLRSTQHREGRGNGRGEGHQRVPRAEAGA